MGGVEGRALRAGDSLPIGVMRQSALMKAPGRLSPPPADGAVVRVLPGPHRDRFDRAAFDTLAASRFALAGESNRMGYRLAGPPIVSLALPELLSDATPMGSIQVLPSGQLILLMADRQTTGGYPRIATVIAADLPLTGQLAPGDWIGFAPCTRADAQAALRLREAELESGS
jgi:antagonist of KipI